MGAERGEQPMQVHAVLLHAPPLETPKEGAGAPPGGYLDPHIKLKQKTRRTEAVDEAPTPELSLIHI